MHHLSYEHVHHRFDAGIPPALTVDDGATVCFQTRDAANNEVRSVEEALTNLTPVDRANPATGPVAIVGAEPGDALAVSINAIDLGPQGYSRIRPGGGVIIDELEPPAAKVPRVVGNTLHFDDRISFPIRPMVGVIAVAPADESAPTFSPGPHGGNMDHNDIRVGSTVLLPVLTTGGLLSIGDVHARMGDGELTGGGCDIEARVTVTITVRKGLHLARPRILTPDEVICCANAPDLREAIRIAASDLTRLAADLLGITREEAFILIGCCGDARIGQAAGLSVDATARVALPRSIFADSEPI